MRRCNASCCWPRWSRCAGSGRLRRFRHGQARRFRPDDKKKLPGDRKPLFPEGVPGVTQGVPPEYFKGNQPPRRMRRFAPCPATPSDARQRRPKSRKPAAEAESRAEAQAETEARQARGAEAGSPRRGAAGAAARPRRDLHLGRRRRRVRRSSTAPWPAAPPSGTFYALADCPALSLVPVLLTRGMKKRMSFTVAIVGRPNVGKSTLFNRLVGRRVALVDDRPGVTRDRREGEARLGDLDFTVIDTAGLEESAPETLSGRMRAQTETAIGQADAIFFMIDARSGPIPDDRAFAALVRKSGKPAC